VNWNHNEEPLHPGPQLTYPGIIFGTSGFPLILKETHLRVVDRATWNIDNASGSHVLKAGLELANISASQTYALVRSGELVAIKVGGRGQWRVERAELETYIKRMYDETRAFVQTHPLIIRDEPIPQE